MDLKDFSSDKCKSSVLIFVALYFSGSLRVVLIPVERKMRRKASRRAPSPA
jgi:hypothetical protein